MQIFESEDVDTVGDVRVLTDEVRKSLFAVSLGAGMGWAEAERSGEECLGRPSSASDWRSEVFARGGKSNCTQGRRMTERWNLTERLRLQNVKGQSVKRQSVKRQNAKKSKGTEQRLMLQMLPDQAP